MKIYDLQGKVKADKKLPQQFSEPLRQDLIARAVQVIHGNTRQPYGSAPDAGKRASAYVSKRRRDFRTTYGIGQSRTPRKIMSRSGTRMNWVGAFAPQTVGGRRAHPPKAEKIWSRKINKKERRIAIRSAISATISRSLVETRGHRMPKEYPLGIDSNIEEVAKAAELKNILLSLGLEKELERTSEKKIRAGRGKSRGRKYVRKVGPLIVVANKCILMQNTNIPGVDVVSVDMLNANVLAPGKTPGRLTIWSEKALERMEKEKLFTNK